MKIIYSLSFLLLLIFPIDFQAQTQNVNTNQEAIKSFVRVPVIVSDNEGRYIPDLNKEDFSIYEDGVQQKITSFSKYNEPIKVALMIDTSKSTRNVIKRIKNAAKNFVDLLNPEDECQVATFDSQLKIINSFSSNHQAIKNSLDKIEINEFGATLIYSAVNQIIQSSFDKEKGRKVIILLTDGNDFGSNITKNELLGQLEESDIAIYTIFFNTSDFYKKLKEKDVKKTKKNKKAPKNEQQNVSTITSTHATYILSEAEIELIERNEMTEAINSLKAISDVTAGKFFQSNVPDLEDVFKNIIGELTQQYQVGYHSAKTGTKQTNHDVTVKVNRPNVIVRNRSIISNKQ